MSLAAVVLVSSVLPRMAAAAESDAHALLQRGLSAYGQGAYADAIEAFSAADKLQPQPALVFDIARSYEQLQDWDDALKYYGEYLARAPEATDRQQVQQHVRVLLARHKPVHAVPPRVKLVAYPTGASVWVDDEPVGRAPVTLELPRGLHRARFKLAGHRTYYTTFDLSNGRKPLEVRAELEPGSDGAQQPREEPAADGGRFAPAAAGSDSPLLRNLGFSAMIASAAALGGAVVFEVMRGDAERSAHNATDQAHSSDAFDRMRTNQMLAQVFAGAGGGLAALGVTLLVLSRADDEQEAHSTRVALMCAPTKCSANLRGVF